MNCDRFKCSLQRRHTVFVTTIELKLFGQMSNSSFLTAGEKHWVVSHDIQQQSKSSPSEATQTEVKLYTVM